MIFPPLSCHGLSGKLAMSNWLTSTSTHLSEDSVLFVPTPVIADIENSRISNLQGDLDAIQAVKTFYESKGDSFKGDIWALNSWHSGIYPKTFYDRDPGEDPERWGNMSFGSPRSVNVIDASISFDDRTLWQNGKFSFLELPEARRLLEKHQVSEEAFEQRWDIGLNTEDEQPSTS